MPNVSRRSFLKGASVAISATPLVGAKGAAESEKGMATIDGNEAIDIATTINGEERKLKVAPMTTLADALREELGLTGTKTVCEGGACGACTVLIGGQPQNACLTLALDADGERIRTIEGLANGEDLHPIQRAFIEADALQCGFCTPGMVMAGVHFFEAWNAGAARPRGFVGNAPTKEIVQEAMAGNLCRCGAQPGIIAAVVAACAGREAKPIGDEIPLYALKRQDGREKVTGKAKYTYDHFPKDGLHAVMLRASHAHQTITDIDVSAAKKMAGVKGVVVMAEKMGGGFLTVRWSGQELVAIAATTLAQAQAAAATVVVKGEKLGVVTTPEGAAADAAPVLYKDPSAQDIPVSAEGPTAPSFLVPWKDNVRGPPGWPLAQDNADAKEAVDASPLAARLQVATNVQVHASLERHVTVVEPTSDGGLVVHATTQTVQILADDLAEALSLPPSKVVVHGQYVGGGFGSKAGVRAEHLAAGRLALQTKNPVRLALTFDAHLTVGGNRPGTVQSISVGANEKGKLNAVVHHGRSNCGAGVGEQSTGMTAGHYTFDEVEIVDDNVVTNAAPSCPWRAPGFPANAFALEQAVDAIAAQGGLDPLDLRIANEDRRRFHAVYRLAQKKSGLKSRLKLVAEDAKNPQARFLRGVGVATAHWFVLTSPSCQVRLRARRDGSINAAVATHDMGQGSRTVIANVLTEMLQVSPEKISVSVGQSDLPPAPGSFGSITTGSIAPATWRAAKELQEELARSGLRAERGVEKSERGLLTKRGKLVPWAALFEDLESDLVEVSGTRGADRDGFRFPPLPFDAFADHVPFAVAKDEVSSAQIAEVEVDRLLGTVRVKRVVVALDAGRIASPITARSQVMGAVMQGVSYALYEARRLDPKTGKNLSASFDRYAILGIADAPEVEVHFLNAPSENNPYGSLGLGENSIIATAAAVANAVFRATGARVTQTPMRPDVVKAAIRAQMKKGA